MTKIIGNTTATPNPRPDWNQTDLTKADYIKNKPSVKKGDGDGSFIANDIEHNIATGTNQVVIGTYNDVNEDALFIVGNGESEATRNNAFEVLKTGDVVINGDLTVNGKSTTIETFNENVNIEDNTITLRHNATTGLQQDNYTGIVAHNYDGTNNGMLVFDNGGTAYVGDEGDLQPLATRAFLDDEDGAIATWDATAKTLVKAPLEVADIVTTDNIDSLNKAISTAITDVSVAYQKEVTVKDTSYAEVNKIGGMSRKCRNLMALPYSLSSANINGVIVTANSDGSIKVSGTTSNLGSAVIADYTLTAGTYNISHTSANVGLQVWAMNGSSYSTELVPTFYNNNKSFTIASTTVIRLRVYIAANKTVSETIYPMLNEGATALPYEPYYAGLRDTKVTEVKSVGSNLACLQEKTVENSGITFTVKDDVITASGTSTSNYASTEIAEFTGLVGTFHIQEIENHGLRMRAVVYDALNNRSLYRNQSFTLNGTERSATIWVYVDNAGTTITNDTAKVMLNYGSTALPYKPYVEHTLPIPAEVQALDGYGVGIDERTYNYIEWQPEDNIKTWHKVVRKLVLTGTENWILNKDGTNPYFMLQIGVLKSAIDGKSVCSHYANAPVWGSTTNDGAYILNSNGYQADYLNIRDSRYSTLDTFKAYLAGQYAAGTPVTVIYVFTTPEVTDISDLITSDNLLGVEDNDTITFENEYGYAVPSEVTLYPEKTDIIASEKIIGNLIGTSTRAIGDENGDNITDTYIKNNVDSIEVGGVTMGFVNAGVTWKFNDDTTELDKCLYEMNLWGPNITFICNGETYNSMTFASSTELYYGDYELLVYSGGWRDEAYKTIEITGECDSDLLQYLSKMATPLPSQGIQIGEEVISEPKAKSLLEYSQYSPSDFLGCKLVGSVFEKMGDYLPTTGIIEEGHIYFLVFRHLQQSFHYFLPTFGYRQENNGTFGGYSERNTDTPLYVKWKEVSYDDFLMPIYGIALYDKDGNNRTNDVLPYGDIELRIYKLI